MANVEDLLGFRNPAFAHTFLVAVESDANADLLIETSRADWDSHGQALFERFSPDPVAGRAALLIAVNSRRLTALKLLAAYGPEQSRLNTRLRAIRQEFRIID